MDKSKAIELIIKWSNNCYEISRSGDGIYAAKGEQIILLFMLKRRVA